MVLQGCSNIPFMDAVLHHLDVGKKESAVHTERTDSETMDIVSRTILGIKENKYKTITKTDL